MRPTFEYVVKAQQFYTHRKRLNTDDAFAESWGRFWVGGASKAIQGWLTPLPGQAGRRSGAKSRCGLLLGQHRRPCNGRLCRVTALLASCTCPQPTDLPPAGGVPEAVPPPGARALPVSHQLPHHKREGGQGHQQH